MNAAFRVDGGSVKSSVDSHAINIDFVYAAFEVLVRCRQLESGTTLLVADTQLYKRLCPYLKCNFPLSVRQLVGHLVGRLVDLLKFSEAGIYKRKQENTLSTKKAIKK